MDLRDELGAAIDGATNETAEVVTPAPAAEPAGDPAQPAEPAAEAPSGDRPRDASGRFVPKSEEPAKTDAQPEPVPSPEAAKPAEGQPQAQPLAVDLPPSTWTAAAKAEYAKLPEVIRGEIKKREADFQKGITQYKTAAEFGSRMDNVIRPYIQTIQQAGGQPDQVVKNLLHTAYTLRTGTPQQKQQLLLQVAQEYGIPLGQPQAPEAGTGIDQTAIAQTVQQLLQPHLQQFQQFQGQFQTVQQQREQAEQQKLASQIEAFRNAADEKGQPKHVYFDNVRGTMAALIDSGDAQSLEDAYVMACRAHPEVSRILEQQRSSESEAKRLAEQKRLADEARRATTVNAQGQGGVGIADTSKLSLRDELSSLLEGNARV